MCPYLCCWCSPAPCVLFRAACALPPMCPYSCLVCLLRLPCHLCLHTWAACAPPRHVSFLVLRAPCHLCVHSFAGCACRAYHATHVSILVLLLPSRLVWPFFSSVHPATYVSTVLPVVPAMSPVRCGLCLLCLRPGRSHIWHGGGPGAARL
jgi:hypothetical protein